MRTLNAGRGQEFARSPEADFGALARRRFAGRLLSTVPRAGSRRPRSPGGFTMIEVMLAIAIMAVICGTIYQFTATVLRSSDVSIHLDAREQSFAGLRRLLGAEFAALPSNQVGSFIGADQEGKHGHRDALQLICPAGNAVLTPDAHGLYRVTLGLDEKPRGSGRYEFVMEREPWSPDETTEGDNGLKTENTLHPAKALPADSVPLLDDVRSLEISYYDPRLNAWQDKWNDDTMIPSLVRVRLAMENGGEPYEFVEHVPSGGIRRGLPNTVGTGAGAPDMSGASIPQLPAGITVPPPPPGGFPNAPVLMPSTGSVVPR